MGLKWQGKDPLHDHQSPLIEALRMKACNPPLLPRESETVCLNTQRNAQGVSTNIKEEGNSRAERSLFLSRF